MSSCRRQIERLSVWRPAGSHEQPLAPHLTLADREHEFTIPEGYALRLDVIEYADIDQSERVTKASRNKFVRLAWCRRTRWVRMGEHQRALSQIIQRQ